jgi:hypothetical protein
MVRLFDKIAKFEQLLQAEMSVARQDCERHMRLKRMRKWLKAMAVCFVGVMASGAPFGYTARLPTIAYDVYYAARKTIQQVRDYVITHFHVCSNCLGVHDFSPSVPPVCRCDLCTEFSHCLHPSKGWDFEMAYIWADAVAVAPHIKQGQESYDQESLNMPRLHAYVAHRVNLNLFGPGSRLGVSGDKSYCLWREHANSSSLGIPSWLKQQGLERDHVTIPFDRLTAEQILPYAEGKGKLYNSKYDKDQNKTNIQNTLHSLITQGIL